MSVRIFTYDFYRRASARPKELSRGLALDHSGRSDGERCLLRSLSGLTVEQGEECLTQAVGKKHSGGH
ncbi:hypothetical protein HDF16_004343 [Granulicella aggregans]|uniref:Uncharacterized protein n=1 Tax=Granulicella aggregans TaxID=474949 RepID=A0A7W7ZGT6_9BACT|nr:hypothetical protein [Granulicella aggregans]